MFVIAMGATLARTLSEEPCEKFSRMSCIKAGDGITVSPILSHTFSSGGQATINLSCIRSLSAN